MNPEPLRRAKSLAAQLRDRLLAALEIARRAHDNAEVDRLITELREIGEEPPEQS
jgi:hypothetical protein